MQQCVCFEEIEAPAIKNIENHFIPNTYLLLKKLKHMSQGRGKAPRGFRRQKMYVVTLKHYQNKTMLYIPAAEHPEQEEFDMHLLEEIEKKQKRTA